jgi:hypothetical protein
MASDFLGLVAVEKRVGTGSGEADHG